MSRLSLSKYIPTPLKKPIISGYELVNKKAKFIKRKFIKPTIPVNSDGKVYLNLGCANTSGKEFINIDVEPWPIINHIQDITDLSNFRDESVDMIYASHVVEHIPREKFASTIKEWTRVLKKGGVFRFAVPNFDALLDIYIKSNRDIDLIQDQVLGQNPPYNNHYTLWSFEKAKNLLEKFGYNNIQVWDANKVEHHDFKDRASRSIKVGSEDILFSLNVEGEKI